MRSTQQATHILTAGVLVLRANLCFAQTNGPVDLTWEAPRDCPQTGEVQQQLRSSLPASNAEQSTSLFHARGTIEPFEGHYRLTLFIEKGAAHGARVIESDDCRSLAKAATIVLALLVQKERTLGRELLESEISGQPSEPQGAESKTTQSPEPPPAPVVEPARPSPLPPAPESTRQWRLLLRAPEGRIDLVTLPRVGYGVGLGLGISYHGWRAYISGTFYDTQKVTSSRSSPYEIAYRRNSFDGKLCRGWRSGALELAPCAVIEADYLSAHASGEYLDASDKSTLGISMGGVVAGYAHLQRHFALVVTAASRVMLNHARFVVGNVTGKEQAHQVPWATLDLGLACEWIF